MWRSGSKHCFCQALGVCWPDLVTAPLVKAGYPPGIVVCDCAAEQALMRLMRLERAVRAALTGDTIRGILFYSEVMFWNYQKLCFIVLSVMG